MVTLKLAYIRYMTSSHVTSTNLRILCCIELPQVYLEIITIKKGPKNYNKTPNFYPSTKKSKEANKKLSTVQQDKNIKTKSYSSCWQHPTPRVHLISVTLINSALTNTCDFRIFKKKIIYQGVLLVLCSDLIFLMNLLWIWKCTSVKSEEESQKPWGVQLIISHFCSLFPGHGLGCWLWKAFQPTVTLCGG